MNNDTPHQMPEMLLEQINEHSNGGFILFTINSEGSPECFSNFDAPIQFLGMARFIELWLDNVDMVNHQSMTDESEIPPDDNEEV